MNAGFERTFWQKVEKLEKSEMTCPCLLTTTKEKLVAAENACRVLKKSNELFVSISLPPFFIEK
ncbi:hypothetical protein RU95_GL003596 [Enterococcus avium]|nr:hypothetical protein RU95_GL003596 [Enterococcus avium]